MEPIDVWRAAKVMARQHGGVARIERARTTDRRLDRGDIEAHDTWLAMRRAAKSPLKNGPP